MNVIKVDNLVKKYGSYIAVDNISFEVKQGELFAFLGENGAGKTTTINILCSIIEKTSGTIEVLDNQLEKSGNKIRTSIGVVFQNSALDPKLTVKENLMIRAGFYGMNKAEIEKRLKILLIEFKLNEISSSKYETLSGGQKRRVDIVRALIHRPKILILDEPTTGLDPMSRKLVWDYIHKLQKEKKLTIFLTTHYMEEVNEADRVVILDKGKMIANNTPIQLKKMWAKDKLIWYTFQNKINEDIIKNFEFYYHSDHYRVDLPTNNDSFNLTEFLYQNKNKIINYEILHGTMDDVFLNLTGRNIGEKE